MQHSAYRVLSALYSIAVVVGRTGAILVGIGAILIVGVPLLLALLYVVRANTIYASVSARYRLEVAVEIDGRKYLGSNVYQIDYDPQDLLFDLSDVEVPAVVTKMRGEALAIDLGDLGELLILLSYDDIHSIVGPLARRMQGPMDLQNLIFVTVLNHHGWGAFNGIRREEIETLTNLDHAVSADSKYFMPMLYVPSTNNIDGVRILFADSDGKDSLSNVFGPSAKILYDKISTTTDSVTREKLHDLFLINKIISKSRKLAGIYIYNNILDEITINDEIGNYILPLRMNDFEGGFFEGGFYEQPSDE